MSSEAQAASSHDSHDETTHTHDHTKTYLKVILALMFLTGITVWAAGINWGSPTANLVIALTIATAKASLVALFFMHLKYESGFNAMVFCSSLFFLSVFLTFTFLDVTTRDPVESTQQGIYANEINTAEEVPMYLNDSENAAGAAAGAGAAAAAPAAAESEGAEPAGSEAEGGETPAAAEPAPN
jgi:cytochrome c oxidase subunit 4